MEYVQERIATLHDLTGRPAAGTADRAAVVVPMTERDHGTLASERLFSALETIDPAAVVVALRAEATEVCQVRDWLDSFDLAVTVLWCNAEEVESVLEDHGIARGAGKGRDVWLGLGVAADAADFVVAHDADSRTVTSENFERLLFPLQHGYEFVKGYYARVEDNRLYGRLCRLFYVPLVSALLEQSGAPIVEYLDAFRYALAGEVAASAAFARQCRPEPGFGLEVGLLGDAFEHCGFERSAQVDLGRYQHDHRAVSGNKGLVEMSDSVGAALFRVLAANGISPDMDRLREAYSAHANRLIGQYETDAAFNELSYDADAEREQVSAYAGSIEAPDGDGRLPAWAETALEATALRDASRGAVDRL